MITADETLCVLEKGGTMDGKLLGELGMTAQEAHGCGVSMAKLSRAIREKEGAPFCILPFCHTVESEAMGGRVNFGDEKTGPRGAGAICRGAEDILQLSPVDLSTGRIAEVLRACRLLSAEGEAVMLNLSGPGTILNGLMETVDVFRLLMTDSKESAAVLARLREQQLDYAAEASRAGVRAISYADPITAPDLLGPDMSIRLAEQFTLPFLRQAAQAMDSRTVIMLCPKTASALSLCGGVRWEEWDGEQGGAVSGGCVHGITNHPAGERSLRLRE